MVLGKLFSKSFSKRSPNPTIYFTRRKNMSKTKILLVGAEVMPFAATGGLGDVLGSLPIALKRQYGKNGDIRVVMPLYQTVSQAWREKMQDVARFSVRLAWRNLYCGIKMLEKDGVKFYFIDNEYYFKRDKLYGHYDDGERYAYFCMAVMEMLPVIEFFPDVLHAHDWQAALSVIYLKAKYSWREKYKNIKSVFTIHNIEYQGKYDFSILGDVFALGYENISTVDYGSCINLMKGAVECADIVSTVSPRYAEEIRTAEFSHGLDGILNNYYSKVCGILNGIDYDYYDPSTDPVLKIKYNSENLDGKYAAKESLLSDLGMQFDKKIPVMAIISRLVSHKGLDLVTERAYI